MIVLGIETSCDDTGVAIYSGEHGLIAHSLFSQIDTHRKYGGVVPELASRDHLSKLSSLVEHVINISPYTLQDIDAIAYTQGPGLIGALLVGASFAKSLAFSIGKPAIGIHHLEGHILAPFLEPRDQHPSMPFLALLVSGGHTQLIHVAGIGQYQIIGSSIDDAVGEAFDKTAKQLGLPYPGGPHLAKLAVHGIKEIADSLKFPLPMINRPGLDFSFSGLKTFTLQTIQRLSPLDAQTKANIALAFEDAVVDTLVKKCNRALATTRLSNLVVAGGVGANKKLRMRLQELCTQHKVKLSFPRPEFCTDNGAMIAYAGWRRLQYQAPDPNHSILAKAKWELANID